MKFKYLIIAAGLGILGFLFYPRNEEIKPSSDLHFIKPIRILEEDTPYYTGIHRSNPLVKTFDLGYVYKFNQAVVAFEEPIKKGPRRFEIIVSYSRKTGYARAHEYAAKSAEYTYQIQRFSVPVEGRWLQIIVDDWFRKKPKLKANEFKVGIQYANPGIVQSASSEYNQEELHKLTDLIATENSKWVVAKRVTEEIEEDGKKKTKVSFSPPEDDVVVTFDLGNIIAIHGTRLTTDGPGNNLKRYEISISVDGGNYTIVYVRPELEDKTVTDLWSAKPEPLQARYVRLKINKGDWYGDYPEIQELEFFTDNYKLPPEQTYDINQYNARQLYYDDCGHENIRSLNLVQGFPFDRGTDDENRYFYPEDELEPGNTESQRSFCYHYDTIVFRYSELIRNALYWVQVTYLQPKDGINLSDGMTNAYRVQNLDVDGYILHGSELELGKGKAQTHTFSIPKSAYADGEIELHFHRLAGINAVVSEVGLFEARPQARQVAVRQTLSRAVKASTPVTIDGNLDEWPILYPLAKQSFSHSEEIPIKVYLQWDEENLYLGAEIDRAVMTKVSGGDDLGDDEIADLLGKLNIFVDTTANRSPGIYNKNDHHLLFYRIGSRKYRKKPKVAQIHHHLDAIPANILDRKKIEFVQSFTKTGYVLEACIPADGVLQEFDPRVGKTIGFNYILSNPSIDNIGWATKKIDAPPSQWGTVELVSQISGQVVVMDESGKNQIDSFSANDQVVVGVWDSDRNSDRRKIETVNAHISGDLTADSEKLTLTECDSIEFKNVPNSDLFAFRLPTSYSTEPISGDGVLQVVGNETVTLTYTDPYYAPGQENKELKVNLKVNVGVNGEIFIQKSGEQIDQFRAGDTLVFEVRDEDLEVKQAGALEKNGHEGENEKTGKRENEKTRTSESQKAEPEVLATSATSQKHETRNIELELKIEETDELEKLSLGNATGSIKTEYATEPTPNDGVLQVAGTQTLIATYIDELQETGQTDVPVTAEAKVEVGDTAILSVIPKLSFNAGTELQIRLKDIDLNNDNSKEDTVEISSNGNMLGDKMTFCLQETGDATGEFVGVCKTVYAAELDPENHVPSEGEVVERKTHNTTLQVKGNEEVTFSYIDALQGTGATNVPVKVSAQVNVGEDGELRIVRSNNLTDVEKFNAGDVLYFRLQDADVSLTDGNKIETVSQASRLTIVGNQTNDKESVKLYQTSQTSAVFIGSIKTEYSEGLTSPDDFGDGNQTSKGDGVLQVRGNEKIIAVYIDKLRRTGETNVSVSDSAIVNTGYTGRFVVYKEGVETDLLDLPASSHSDGRFKAGETLVLEIEDLDLSRTNAVAELFETNSSEDMVRDKIRVSMREIAGNAGVFRGKIQTEYGQRAIPNDRILQVQGLGLVTFTYVDALQETGKTQVPISVQLLVETGTKGNLEIYTADNSSLIAGSEIGMGSFSAGDALNIRLTDSDLNIDRNSKDSAQVTVAGNLKQDELSLWISETENNSGVFQGKLLTEYSDTYDPTDSTHWLDEMLQVTDKEVVSVKYRDQIVTTGETDVLIEARAIVLSSNPGILRIVDENDQELGSFNAGRTIYFLLEDLLLSTVDATVTASITVNGDKTNDRFTVLLERIPGEEGRFRGAISTRYGRMPIYDDTLDVQGDEEITATYQPNIPVDIHKRHHNSLTVQDTAYVNKGNRGQIAILKNDGTPVHNFNAGAMLYFRLEDLDLNRAPFEIDFADIWVSTEGKQVAVESTGNYVHLREEGENSGIFIGSLKTEHGISSQSFDVLGLIGGEIVKATYTDRLIDTGETNVKIMDTCRANLIGWATFATEEVLIDGIPDKWPMETVLNTEQDEALMWVQWDRDNLYILAQIYDDEIVVTDATKWYEGGTDAIELHIDLNPDDVEKPSHLRKTNEENEFVFWLCPKGRGFGGIRPYAGRYEPSYVPNYTPPIDVSLKSHLNDPKPFYILEIAIPFNPSLGGFDPMKTTRIDKIGFNYVIYRSDAPIVQWAKPEKDSEDVPLSKLGMLYLERIRF